MKKQCDNIEDELVPQKIQELIEETHVVQVVIHRNG